MKPQELYSGQAPIAMGQMGQGLAQVGANIANSTLAGYEGLARGIGTGIQSLVGEYKKYQEAEKNNKAYERLFQNPVAQKALGLSPDTAQQFLNQAHRLGTKERHDLFSSFLPMAMQQSSFEQKARQEKELTAQKAQADLELHTKLPFTQQAASQYGLMMQGMNAPQKQAGYGGGISRGIGGAFSPQDLSLAPFSLYPSQ